MEEAPLLIDRDEERAELTALAASGRPALALLTGRRRVGKTFLLSHAWPPERLFLFTASRSTGEINRQQLLADLTGWTGDELRAEDYPTWRTVFRLIVDIASRRGGGTGARAAESTIVVLDEFQYLADGDAGVAAVASELNAVWEETQRRRDTTSLPLLLVLAGSAVGTMEALAAGGAPLYGRFSWQHKLQPFTYWHAGELAGFRSARDRAIAYGVFGGTPRYLAAGSPRRSVAENIVDLMLSPRGEVRLLVETALDQEEGLRDVPKYRAILRAVADGQTERNTIAQRVGLPNDSGLRVKLATLVALGYLEERLNIDAAPNSAARYAVADAALRFHHRFVAPNLSMLERYPASALYDSTVAPGLDTYMGLEFERIATQAYDRRARADGLPLVERWGRWEGTDRLRRSLEIDIVAPLADGRTMTGAVKWGHSAVGAGVHTAHMAMLERAADAGRAWAHAALEPNAPLYYLAAAGFTRAFHEAVEESGHPAVCWSLAEIYE